MHVLSRAVMGDQRWGAATEKRQLVLTLQVASIQ
ncbi:hypothetical protein M8C21_021001 [Ambrosia artemisiifolia]|uniref:Uncharacterized protein n=1 Tax=Ambrosia artemisiifolia TaxID=4212 RepID=A0AAD5CRH9_AMBAR|nr:hypothetical protein M8C21_021001 [Ambrosia artemisiifolia]